MNLNQDENIQIAQQKQLTFSSPPSLNIKEACKVGKGILQFPIVQKANYIQKFIQSQKETTFFIPASGAGSRMFEFLYKFLHEPNDENQGKVERFISHFEELAFAKKIPQNLIQQLKEGEISLEDFIHYLMEEKGLNLGNLPKGLIPFHRIDPFILSPFQSQILQGIEIAPNRHKFHFTIAESFKNQIISEQQNVINLIAQKIDISYSNQNSSTDSYTFDEQGNILLNPDKTPIKRPAGHGALIENLSAIKSDIIFIKNIDNLQHFNKSQQTFETFQFLGGLLLEIEAERNALLNNFSKDLFYRFNSKYEIIPANDIETHSIETLQNLLNLPIRVCGMVKNEGEPGGGPFWLTKDGITRKQIIEKAQINSKEKQYSLLINSTHFNPVIMALRNADKDGKAFDLTQLVDNEQYLCVKKNQHGKTTRYVEKPGLWNGSMYNWLTIFVEIPSDTFSPVKSILDLLNPLHQEK